MEEKPRKKRWSFRLLALCFALFLSLLLGEIAARIYYRVLKSAGNVLEGDPVLGWRFKPDLDLARERKDGGTYRVRSKASGFPTEARWAGGEERRVLLIGDSFAAGTGVNPDDRLDRVIAARMPGWGIVNLGVPAYGTDQALLAAEPLFPELRSGDALVVLTYWGNDLDDIASTIRYGRSKPWYSLKDGELERHDVVKGLRYALRDRLDVARALYQVLDREEYTLPVERIERAVPLFEALVRQKTEGLRRRGVHVLVAHHGVAKLDRRRSDFERIRGVLKRLDQAEGLGIIPLDEFVGTPGQDPGFLLDGHWNPEGHRLVAEAIRARLVALFDGTRDD